MANLQTKSVALEQLAFDKDNVRKHDRRNIEAIKSSLERFGQRKPLVVWNGTVIAGNGTLQAAHELGWNKIVVTYAPEDWSEDEAKAFAVADNRTAELAQWDADSLAAQLLQFPEELRTSAGFLAEDIEALGEAWESDMAAMESITATDSVAKGKLVVTFDEMHREEVREAVTNCVDSLGLDGVTVA